MTWRVPLADVAIAEEDVQAVLETLRSGWLTMGPRTQELEAGLASWHDVPHAVAVSSGTAALHLAMRALDVGPGDEVVVPALTFVASASAVRLCGAEAVLCDVRGPEDLNLDVASVEARLTDRTKAVVAVHFAGYPAAVEELRTLCDARGIALVEDAAQAIGAVVAEDGRLAGTVGDLGCCSFFSKKQLVAGEGGMVVSSDEALAGRVRSLRSHAMTSVTWERHRGHAATYDITDLGYNYRIDEPRAALVLSRLRRLRDDLAARRAVVRRYREALAGIEGLTVPWDDAAVERGSHFAFVVVLPDRTTRDAVREGLKERGVQTTWYPALSSFSDLQAAGARPEDTPRATELAGRHVALPLSPSMGDEEVGIVADALRGALAAGAGAGAGAGP